VARRLKAKKPATRIIALTGFSHEEARAKVKEAGFDAHVVKPLRLNELQDMLDRFRPTR
jgi:CheY-like chemotaxis protein